jgi:hypothetical protein
MIDDVTPTSWPAAGEYRGICRLSRPAEQARRYSDQNIKTDELKRLARMEGPIAEIAPTPLPTGKNV